MKTLKIKLNSHKQTWAGTWALEENEFRKRILSDEPPIKETSDSSVPAHTQIEGSTAMVPVVGCITKYPAIEQMIYGGTSAFDLQNKILTLRDDPRVSAILLYVDTPGGEFSASYDVAETIREVAQIKPVVAWISGNCHSAGYLIASQCTKIYCNTAGVVGSIGCYSVIYDTSRAADNAGVTVHVVKSGEYKGIGVDGTAVSSAALEAEQQEVNDSYDLLVNAVAAGRGLAVSKVVAVADGRSFIASKALEYGLIDAIASSENVIEHIKNGEIEIMSKKEIKAEEVKATEIKADEIPAVDPRDAKIASLEELVAQLTSAKAAAESQSAEAIAAKTKEDARIVALKAAFTDAEFVVAQIAKGNDVLAAKAEYADVLAAEIVQLKRQAAATGADPVVLAKAPESAVKGELLKSVNGNVKYAEALERYEAKAKKSK